MSTWIAAHEDRDPRRVRGRAVELRRAAVHLALSAVCRAGDPPRRARMGVRDDRPGPGSPPAPWRSPRAPLRPDRPRQVPAEPADQREGDRPPRDGLRRPAGLRGPLARFRYYDDTL